MRILHIETDAVITNKKYKFIDFIKETNFYLRDYIYPAELNGIA